MKHLGLIFLQADGGGMSTLIIFGGMFLVMYLFMIRPNLQKQKKEKKYQEELKRGDWVVTTSGMHGKIFELSNDTVVLETGAGKIKFERAAVSRDLSSARYGSEPEKKS